MGILNQSDNLFALNKLGIHARNDFKKIFDPINDKLEDIKNSLGDLNKSPSFNDKKMRNSSMRSNNSNDSNNRVFGDKSKNSVDRYNVVMKELFGSVNKNLVKNISSMDNNTISLDNLVDSFDDFLDEDVKRNRINTILSSSLDSNNTILKENMSNNKELHKVNRNIIRTISLNNDLLEENIDNLQKNRIQDFQQHIENKHDELIRRREVKRDNGMGGWFKSNVTTPITETLESSMNKMRDYWKVMSDKFRGLFDRESRDSGGGGGGGIVPIGGKNILSMVGLMTVFNGIRNMLNKESDLENKIARPNQELMLRTNKTMNESMMYLSDVARKNQMNASRFKGGVLSEAFGGGIPGLGYKVSLEESMEGTMKALDLGLRGDMITQIAGENIAMLKKILPDVDIASSEFFKHLTYTFSRGKDARMMERGMRQLGAVMRVTSQEFGIESSTISGVMSDFALTIQASSKNQSDYVKRTGSVIKSLTRLEDSGMDKAILTSLQDLAYTPIYEMSNESMLHYLSILDGYADVTGEMIDLPKFVGMEIGKKSEVYFLGLENMYKKSMESMGMYDGEQFDLNDPYKRQQMLAFFQQSYGISGKEIEQNVAFFQKMRDEEGNLIDSHFDNWRNSGDRFDNAVGEFMDGTDGFKNSANKLDEIMRDNVFLSTKDQLENAAKNQVYASESLRNVATWLDNNLGMTISDAVMTGFMGLMVGQMLFGLGSKLAMVIGSGLGLLGKGALMGGKGLLSLLGLKGAVGAGVVGSGGASGALVTGAGGAGMMAKAGAVAGKVPLLYGAYEVGRTGYDAYTSYRDGLNMGGDGLGKELAIDAVQRGGFRAGGAVVGGLLGSFLGPLGTAAGIAAGQYVGGKLGDHFVGDVRKVLAPAGMELVSGVRDIFRLEDIDRYYSQSSLLERDVFKKTEDLMYEGHITKQQFMEELINQATTFGITDRDFRRIVSSGIFDKSKVNTLMESIRNSLALSDETVNSLKSQGYTVEEIRNAWIDSTGTINIAKDGVVKSFRELESSAERLGISLEDASNKSGSGLSEVKATGRNALPLEYQPANLFAGRGVSDSLVTSFQDNDKLIDLIGTYVEKGFSSKNVGDFLAKELADATKSKDIVFDKDRGLYKYSQNYSGMFSPSNTSVGDDWRWKYDAGLLRDYRDDIRNKAEIAAVAREQSFQMELMKKKDLVRANSDAYKGIGELKYDKDLGISYLTGSDRSFIPRDVITSVYGNRTVFSDELNKYHEKGRENTKGSMITSGPVKKPSMWNPLNWFASGISNVPSDGYPAILHKGEMVLPAKQANWLRVSMGQSPVPMSNETGPKGQYNSFVNSLPQYASGIDVVGSDGMSENLHEKLDSMINSSSESDRFLNQVKNHYLGMWRVGSINMGDFTNKVKEALELGYIPGGVNLDDMGSGKRGNSIGPIPLKDGDMSWLNKLGAVSKKYEVGDRGPGFISSGKGDWGGKSYGLYQFPSNQSASTSLMSFINSYGYSDMFRGLGIGSSEFDSVWRSLGEKDVTFGDKQHKYILDNYYKVYSNRLKKSLGLDLSSRSRALQEMAWSTSVQYGMNTNVFDKALSGKNLSVLSDADIVTLVQNYKRGSVDSYFSSSSKEVRDSIRNNRTKDELSDLLNFVNMPALKGFRVGGVIDSPVMAMMGEDSPSYKEYVIPTNPRYRARAVELIKNASNDVGVGVMSDGVTGITVNVDSDNGEVVNNLEILVGKLDELIGVVRSGVRSNRVEPERGISPSATNIRNYI